MLEISVGEHESVPDLLALRFSRFSPLHSVPSCPFGERVITLRVLEAAIGAVPHFEKFVEPVTLGLGRLAGRMF